MFLLATASFWTVRAHGIVWGYYSLFNIARLPDAAMRGFFRVVFTFVVPMLLVANVPARLLVDKLGSPLPLLLLLGMCALCQVAAEAGWRFSLRHYTSASS
jgi:ABC-2 type transport system permease protein